MPARDSRVAPPSRVACGIYHPCLFRPQLFYCLLWRAIGATSHSSRARRWVCCCCSCDRLLVASAGHLRHLRRCRRCVGSCYAILQGAAARMSGRSMCLLPGRREAGSLGLVAGVSIDGHPWFRSPATCRWSLRASYLEAVQMIGVSAAHESLSRFPLLRMHRTQGRGPLGGSVVRDGVGSRDGCRAFGAQLP